MKLLPAQTLVTLLLAVGIEQALALPTADTGASIDVRDADLANTETSYDARLRRALEPVVVEGETIYPSAEDLNLDLSADEEEEDQSGEFVPRADVVKPTDAHTSTAANAKAVASDTSTVKAVASNTSTAHTATTLATDTSTAHAANPTATAVATATPGDDQDHPIKRDFPASETNVNGLQELFDADCAAHLCHEIPVTISWWNESSLNRGVKEGNGVGSRAIFKKDHVKFDTKSPDDFKKYVSPEEWPPASSAQGGRPAILYPVTVDAQNRQKTLLSAYYSKKPSVKQQKGVKGSSKGSWVRITAFDGAKGPYCKKLNDLLKDFDGNFNKDGTLKSSKKPDICTKTISPLNGVAYDMEKYAYKLNSKGDGYDFVGKK
ncbi:hypothetical protein AMS68_002208 [Peltaster fructicola]|uniref:Uncharacterized protein n=1 Tax=Peltaster fructicola TaxID=286661 RepID=A0A6H0XPW3_9PEZI|nr:hypothetical protein AMS68_002208 [Peltaster fructicola]